MNPDRNSYGTSSPRLLKFFQHLIESSLYDMNKGVISLEISKDCFNGICDFTTNKGTVKDISVSGIADIKHPCIVMCNSNGNPESCIKQCLKKDVYTEDLNPSNDLWQGVPSNLGLDDDAEEHSDGFQFSETKLPIKDENEKILTQDKRNWLKDKIMKIHGRIRDINFSGEVHVDKRYRIGLYDCIRSYCSNRRGHSRKSCILGYCHRNTVS